MNENKLLICREEIYKVLDKYGYRLSVGRGELQTIILEKIQMYVTDLPSSVTLYPRY